MYTRHLNTDDPVEGVLKSDYYWEHVHIGAFCACGWPMEPGAPKCVTCLQTEHRARWQEATAHLTGIICLEGVHHEEKCDCD